MLCLAVGYVASAQTIVSGRVVDSETEVGIIGVNVVATNGSARTVTDANGEFSFEVRNDTSAIEVSFFGYENVVVEIAGVTEPLHISMKYAKKGLTESLNVKVGGKDNSRKDVASDYRFAIKTNVLYDFTGSVNLGIELPIVPHWTIDISGQVNNWDVYNGTSLRNVLIQPEARYWLKSSMAGHFVALHAHYGEYNMGNVRNNIRFLGTHFDSLSERRYDGWLVGVGVGYGYVFNLVKNLNLELEIGLGYAHMDYETFSLTADNKLYNNTHNYWGITKLNVGLVYCF